MLVLNLLLKVNQIHQILNVILCLVFADDLQRTGMVEGLSQEVAPFGIKTLLIEPGRFRTKLLSANNMRVGSLTIPDYADFSKILLKGLANEDQMQPGDPGKLVNIILDIVRREGVASGMNMPARLPLGSDVYFDIKTKCEETLTLLRNWEAVIRSTNFSA